MTTLRQLLRDPNSPLLNVDVKEAFQPEIFDSLPVDAVESLFDLLPLADLTFIRAKPDQKPDDKLEIIIPESIDEALALKQDPWCSPYISPHVFDNPDFRVAWEDFLVLLNDGYYEVDESDVEEEQKECERKEETPYKDDAYERYWGERIEMQQKQQQKKRKGRAPHPKKRKQNHEEPKEYLDNDSTNEHLIKKPTKAKRGRPKKQ